MCMQKKRGAITKPQVAVRPLRKNMDVESAGTSSDMLMLVYEYRVLVTFANSFSRLLVRGLRHREQ